MMQVDANKGKFKKSVTLEVIGAHDYFELAGLAWFVNLLAH